MSGSIHRHNSNQLSQITELYRHIISPKFTPQGKTIYAHNLIQVHSKPHTIKVAHFARQRATLSMTIWHHNSLSYCNYTKSPIFAKTHTPPRINFQRFSSFYISSFLPFFIHPKRIYQIYQFLPCFHKRFLLYFLSMGTFSFWGKNWYIWYIRFGWSIFLINCINYYFLFF